MLRYIVALIGLATFCLGSPLILHDGVSQGIQLPTGRYFGAHDANTSTTTYYAIPYAYSSRFEPSQFIDAKQDLTPDAQVNATTHGPACVNFNLPPPYDKSFGLLIGSEPIKPSSEDCLTMDVYVPDGNYEDLPVLFYTPGGGFLIGASFQYDMKPVLSRSAALGKPFIAVAINYRLGPLGFLNPSTWGNEINLGLLDQVNALRYVKKYIGAFGGSPEKVTIMGESAGAESTMHQMLWTNEKFFRSAWLMSVPAASPPFLARKPSYKDSLVNSYANACGCNSSTIEDSVGCLREASVHTLTNHSAEWEGSMTSLGGSYVRENVFDFIREGGFPKVPVVFSICRDEGTSQAIPFKSNSTAITSIAIEQLSSGRGLEGKQAADFLRQMLAAYPNDPALGCPFDGLNTTYNQPSQFKRMAAISTDGTYAEGWSEFLDTFSSETNAWGIVFEQPIKGTPPAYGVQHGSDVVYYFPTLAGPKADPRGYGQRALVDAIHDALINFVYDGDPNGSPSLSAQNSSEYVWPLYSETGMVTALNATEVTTAIPPPHRPGFDVIHRFLRPGPLLDARRRDLESELTALNLQA